MIGKLKSHNDFRLFAQSVIRRGRFVFEPYVDEFLKTVLATAGGRIWELESDAVLVRAQLGHHWESISVDPGDPDAEIIEIECAYPIDV